MSFFVPKGPTIPPSGNFNDLLVNKLKTIEGGAGQPEGPNNSVQVNSSGSFSGSSDFVYSSNSLTVGNTVLGSTNLGFFGNSVTQQSADNNTLEEVLSLLRAYGLSKNLSWVQEGSKLVGTGGIGQPFQGFSVSLSSDGNTLAIGGIGDDTSVGATWIFTRSAGVWTQQAKLIGTGYIIDTYQGQSVSLSSDGNTLAVGGSADDAVTGATWIFTRTAGVWTQQGSKLVGTGAIGSSIQGTSVSLSSDGNTLAVGGTGDDTGIGATWIFTRTAGVWTQQGSKLIGTGFIDTPAQGRSVFLSSDGNTLAVGGHSDDSNIGATWIFTRTAGVWTQQGSKLIGTGYMDTPRQGNSVSLSSDGNTLGVGGNEDDTSIGATWIFTRTAGVWSQQGSKLVGTGGVGQSFQGADLSLSSDGNTLAVGGPYDNNFIGATWIFIRTAGIWTQQTKLVGTGASGTAQQGSVSLSGDGNTLAIGGETDNSNIGATWIYTRTL